MNVPNESWSLTTLNQDYQVDIFNSFYFYNPNVWIIYDNDKPIQLINY